METSAETDRISQPTSDQVSVLKIHFSTFETEQLALKAKILELEKLASENEVSITNLKAEVNSETKRREDAEKKIQTLRQFVVEQNETINQLFTTIKSNTVHKTTQKLIAEVDDAFALDKIFKTVYAKLEESAMERFQIQLEVEQITNQVFEALKSVFLLKEKSAKLFTKNVVSYGSGNQAIIPSKTTPSSNPSELNAPLCVSMRPKRKISKPNRLVEILSTQTESNKIDGKSIHVKSKTSRIKTLCDEEKGNEIRSEVSKIYCLCTKSFESHAKLSEHIKQCSKQCSKTSVLLQNISPKKEDLTHSGLIKDLVCCVVQCGKFFITQSHMIQHKMKAHGLDELARTETKVVSNLNKAHSMENSKILVKDSTPKKLQRVATFACKICGKHFAGSKLLKTHLVSSHGKDSGKSSRQWRCEACKTFHKTLSQLLDHQKDCRSFKTSNLEHKRRRKSNRPQLQWLDVPPGPVSHSHVFAKFEANQYFCSCGTVVKNRQRLISHIREKRLGNIFKCTICSAAFPRYAGLKTHMKKTHNLFTLTETFGCKECGKTFDALDKINSHRKKFHE